MSGRPCWRGWPRVLVSCCGTSGRGLGRWRSSGRRAEASCRAIAIERDPDRATRISRNAVRLGVPDIQVVTEDTGRLGLLEELPVPNAIFVGGGANEDVIERCWSEMGVGGRLVVAAVTVETEQVVLAAADRTAVSWSGWGSNGCSHSAGSAAGSPPVRSCCGARSRRRVTVHFIGAGPGAADLLTCAPCA